MENIIARTLRVLVLTGALLIFGVMRVVNAQTFTLNPATTDAAQTQFVNGEVKVDYTAADFSIDPTTTYYWFYTDADPSVYENWSENIIGTSSNANAVFTYNWPSSGTYNLYLAGLNGDFDSEDRYVVDVGYTTAGTSNVLENGSFFNRPGVRSLTSNPSDFSGQQVRFTLYLQTNALAEANEIVVEFSNNGTNWTVMTSTTAQDSYFGSFSGYQSFDIPTVSATTQVRIRQVSSNNLAINASTWYIEDAYFELGNPIQVEGFQLVGNYTVENLLIETYQILNAVDANITGGNVFPNATLKVSAFTQGFDINDYNYTAVIQDNDGNFYPLSGLTVVKADPEITITGTVPTNIPYDLDNLYTNNVYILAFEGSVLRLGLLVAENNGTLTYTLSGGTYGSGVFSFNQAGDRNITTDSLMVNSATDSHISFYLKRLNNFRSPSGTEVVVEYSINGTDYIQLQEINLNTLSQNDGDGQLYDNFSIAIPVGAISSNTQFRIRQKANNGLDLDVWVVDNLEISVNSNINEDIIDYTSSSINVLPPTLNLSLLNIPDALSYPGDPLSLTFNVSNGRFPVGTIANAYVFNGSEILLGSTTINNTGANTINFNVPAIPSGDYEVYVYSESGVKSNSVYLPVYGIQIEVDEVLTEDGIQEGAENNIYPGSAITVNYSITGNIPSDAQLDVQVYDYNTTTYITVTSTTDINGSIDLTLPTGIDYNFGAGGDPTGDLILRLVISQNGEQAAEAYFNTDNMLQLSVSQSTIANPFYTLGQQTTIQFNTDGPFPDNTAFAVVLENIDDNSTYYVLGTTENQGAVSVDVIMPNYAEDENGNTLFNQLRIVPFIQDEVSSTYRRDLEIYLDEDEDFGGVSGEGSYNQAGDYSQFYFNQTGNRGLITENIDLSMASEATISFYLELYGMDINSNIQTLPRLQVSIDGGASFQDLATQGDDLLGGGILYNSLTYIVASIPEEFLTTETQFRIYQPLNLGANLDTWYVTDVEISIGSSNELDDFYYDNFQNPQSISLSEPSISNYAWSALEQNIDPIFNGDEFDFSWLLAPEVTSTYPVGTEFTFVADFIDQDTNQPFVLGTITELDTFTAQIPSYVLAGDYDISVFVSYQEGDEIYVYNYQDDNEDNINDGYYVGSIRVYNRVLRTEWVSGNEVLYAGGDATFSANFENDATADDLAYYNTLYFNLLVNYDGYDWLLDVQQGFENDFTVALPPFITGSPAFRVEVTEGGPIGVLGQIVPNGTRELLADSTSKVKNFENIADIVNMNTTIDGSAVLKDVSGVRQLTTKTFNTTAVDVVEYTVYFDQNESDLTNIQKLVFEFSTDNGSSYTELDQYPDALFEDTDMVNVRLILTEAVQAENVRFRFRQTESKGNITISDFKLISNQVFPFETISVSPNIKLQGIEVASIEGEIKCSDEPIVLDYKILGRFGEENIMQVLYQDEQGIQTRLGDIEFNISEGSGSLEFNLPEDFFSLNNNNRNLKFALKSLDFTFDETGSEYGLGYIPDTSTAVIIEVPIEIIMEDVVLLLRSDYGPITGTFSEYPVEIVAPISYSSGINYILGASEFDCPSEERFVKIADPQNHFRYSIRNKSIGLEITNFVYSADDGIDSVSIGAITEKTVIEVVATALSSDGTFECGSQLLINSDGLNYTNLLFDVRPEYTLHYQDNSGIWQPADGLTFDVCEGSTELSLAGVYFDNAGNAHVSGAQWFVSTNTAGFFSQEDTLMTFDGSGDYSATLISPEGCEFITGSVTINVIPNPAKPVITTSGTAIFCQGGSVVLSAPAGFESYEWQRNGAILSSTNANQIEVNTSGNYSLRVSNGGCFSPISLSVPVQVFSIPEELLLSIDNITFTEGYVYNSCSEELVLYANAGANPIRWFRDGVEIPSNNPSDARYLYVSQNGSYSATVYSDPQLTCSVSSLSVTININAVPANPLVEATLDGVASAQTVFEFCNNAETLVLNGPEGFESYQWFVNGTLLNVNSRFITVDRSGNYNLKVGNGTCYSENSALVQVTFGAVPAEVELRVDNQLMASGQVYTTCNQDFELYMNVNPANYTTRWFRDNVELANTNATTVNYLTANQSGRYQGFVYSKSVTSCFVATQTIDVVIEAVPATPTISSTLNGAASGLTSFSICNNADELILSGPAGFNSYQWTRNGNVLNVNAQIIDVQESGNYQLLVSNGSCYSQASSVVTVNVGQVPAKVNMWVGNAAVEQANYTACGTEVQLRIDSDPDDYYIRWFRNGVEVTNTNIADPNFYTVTSNGAYQANVYSENGSGCVMNSATVNITLSSLPATPSISVNFNGSASTNTVFEFCEGESDLILSGPFGATGYRWYRDGSLIAGLSSSASITVNQSGSYRVSVLSTDLCESTRSLPVNVTIRLKPGSKSFTPIGGNLCEGGTADFEIFGASTSEVYQLYRVVNRNPYQIEASGNPVIGNATGETIITSAVISESTQFVLGISNNFANSCQVVYTNEVSAEVENVTIDIVGNTLTAKLVAGGSIQSYQWFRNDAPINNGGRNSSIQVFDDAEYRVNVSTYNGCELSISTSELGGDRILGFSQQLQASDISLYPNPSSDVLNVKIANAYLGDLRLRIINVSGQQIMEQVFEKSTNEYQVQLSVAQLKEGIYMLQIITDNGSETLRVVRN